MRFGKIESTIVTLCSDIFKHAFVRRCSPSTKQEKSEPVSTWRRVRIFRFQMSEERNNRNRQQKSGRASEFQTLCRFILEQDTGLEPAAYCLGSSRSTGWANPASYSISLAKVSGFVNCFLIHFFFIGKSSGSCQSAGISRRTNDCMWSQTGHVRNAENHLAVNPNHFAAGVLFWTSAAFLCLQKMLY